MSVEVYCYVLLFQYLWQCKEYTVTCYYFNICDSVRMQVFRTKGRGWGVRSLTDIPKGTFICE